MKKRHIVGLLAILAAVTVTFNGCMSSQSVKEASASVKSTSSESATATAGKTVIKISDGNPDEHPANVGAREFKKLIEAKYPDKFSVQIYPNAQLGDDTKATQDCAMGNLEMAISSASPLTGMDFALGVFDLPFIVPNDKAADAIFDGKVGKEIAAGLDAKGLHLLAYYENGFREITNSKREIKTPADLKGLKIRTMENNIHLAAFKAMGASPTPLPFSEVFTALQQKTVDGQENPISTIYLNKYNEVQKYCTITNHLYGPHLMLMSESFWKQLTSDEQKYFTEAAQKSAVLNRKTNRQMCEDDLKKLKANGMTITELTDSERQAFIDDCKPVYNEYESQIGESLVKEFQQEVSKYK